jgi:membrane protease YdiL (CAAX protease family)
MEQSTLNMDHETGAPAYAGWEILSVGSSLLIAEWVVLVFVGRSKLVAAIPVGLAFGFMFCSHRLRGESMRDIGFRIDNLKEAARSLLLPTVIAGLAILFVGWLGASLRFELLPMRPRFLLLPGWAFAQQYVMQGFVNRRAQMALGPGVASVLVVAAMFAVLHLPNLPLAALTFTGGLVWASVYQRSPNLLAPALSHSLLSILLAFSLPPAWLNGLRVGFKYFG